MALSIQCTCGVPFEVEDSLAGQVVTCPACQASTQAPALERTPVRTSGLALASMILALVGAFTLIFTLLAVLLGACALLSIKRNREQLAGAGYAIFGIVAGTLFTGLGFFLYTKIELMPVDSYLEAGLYSSMIDYSGDREVQRKDRGYAITRPTAEWGVAKKGLMVQLGVDGELMLVNPHRHAYVQVITEPVFGRSLEAYADSIIKSYQEDRREAHVGLFSPKIGGFKLRDRRSLKRADGLQGIELFFDMRVGGEEISYLEHILQPAGREEFFRINGWTSRRRFSQLEEELRRGIDSFRLIR
jgi:hypothetical protein